MFDLVGNALQPIYDTIEGRLDFSCRVPRQCSALQTVSQTLHHQTNVRVVRLTCPENTLGIHE
jgi:sulfopyruvate decarboxylase TPP-binding subunit